jgi:hypothetical protein
MFLALAEPDRNYLFHACNPPDFPQKSSGGVRSQRSCCADRAVVCGPPAKGVAASARGWCALEVVEEDSVRFGQFGQQLLDPEEVGVEGFPVSYGDPGVDLDDFALSGLRQPGIVAAPLRMTLDTGHPFRMRIRHLRIAADLHPVVDAESGLPHRGNDVSDLRLLTQLYGKAIIAVPSKPFEIGAYELWL